MEEVNNDLLYVVLAELTCKLIPGVELIQKSGSVEHLHGVCIYYQSYSESFQC